MIDLTPDVSTPRGAPIGRATYCDIDPKASVRLSVRYLPLSQGYDRGGAYWGNPSNLYGAGDANGNVRLYVHARDRAHAIEQVRMRHPNAIIHGSPEAMNYTATYSPDDNKIRLTASARLPADVYERVKACRFQWAPKQSLFYATWNPQAADLAEELAGSIEDEDTTLCERAEIRAERFEEYSDRRSEEYSRAHAAVARIADNIPLGQPILIGHHSEKRARKDAERIQSGMAKAVRLWDTANYWTGRAAGALAHAKYLERPDVRARRIKTIEADLRREERSRAEALAHLSGWEVIAKAQAKQPEAACIRHMAERLAGYGGGFRIIVPSDEKRSPYSHAESAWDALTYWGTPEREWSGAPCTVADVLRWVDKARERWMHPEHSTFRWIEHYNNRLAYERAMLGQSGYQEAPKKPTKAVLPLLNYSGSVHVKGCWGNPDYTAETHAMTKAEFAKIYSDYKGTHTSADGTHRVRCAMVGRDRKLSPVFLTDSKVHARPGDGDETDVRIVKAQATIDAKSKAHAAVATRNRAIVDEHRITVIATPNIAQVAADIEAMRNAKVEVVSAPQLFPTPRALAERMIAEADIQPGHSVLEPSAGTGALLACMPNVRPHGYVVAVEVNRTLADNLSETADKTHCVDFLRCGRELGDFDRIIMNPPFANGDDIRHILHARTFLKPGGLLVAICAGGPRQKAALEPLASLWEPLAPGTFASAHTGVNTVLLTIEG